MLGVQRNNGSKSKYKFQKQSTCYLYYAGYVMYKVNQDYVQKRKVFPEVDTIRVLMTLYFLQVSCHRPDKIYVTHLNYKPFFCDRTLYKQLTTLVNLGYMAKVGKFRGCYRFTQSGYAIIRAFWAQYEARLQPYLDMIESPETLRKRF